ncbi:hypothetical protein CerSpe_238660 [Prunus speciosa]
MLPYKSSMIKLVLFLSLTHVLFSSSAAAASTTRSLKINKEALLGQSLVEEGDVGLGEGFIEGRMDLETTDYSGVGANPEHDPKPPGRV